MIPIAFIWDNLTRLSGVSTWLLQCIDRLPNHGLDPWIVDLGSVQGGELDTTRWQHRILFLPCTRSQSEEGWRRRVRKALHERDIRAVVFNEHRFGEDVLWSLPEEFPAANVLHADRPDMAYYQLAASLHEHLRESWCVSPSIARKFKSQLSEEHSDAVHYLPLGIPAPEGECFVPYHAGSPIELLYSGRICQKQKRILDVPVFCSALDALGIPWRFQIVGDGPELPTLRRELQAWVDRGAVILHGAVSYDRAMEIASKTHLLLLFSSYEGLPLSLLEAMARGNLPVVTDIESGISDILVDSKNGLLFPVEQPQRAAERVAECMRDPSRLHILRRETVITAGRFEQGPCMEAYAERIRCLALSDPEARACWKRPRPTAYRNRPWRARMIERLPGWLAGCES